MTRPGRPSPQAAYAQWLDACAAAGWRAGVPGTEQVPVRYALGRVTAAPVRSRWAAPRFACAAMDGVAVSAGTLGPAGDASGRWRLAASEFAWVDTGDPIPPGTDTVMRRERVERCADGGVLITGPVSRGLHVRAAGEDFRADELLLPAGHRLRPADLAAVAAAGHASVPAARQPRVAIIPTGNEIQPVGSALQPGEIIDSNSLMVAARAGEAGARTQISDVQRDDPDALAGEVRRAAAAADLVLIIAGSSAGRSDHTAAVLAKTGGLAVRGAAVRPGHPVLLGYATRDWVRPGRPAAAVPAIGVPGYPLAAAVIVELFAVPLLAALQGSELAERTLQPAQLACDWASPPGVEDWVLVHLTAAPAGRPGGSAVVARPSGHGAGAISRLVRASAWWPIPIGQGNFARGTDISVLPITGAPRFVSGSLPAPASPGDRPGAGG